MDDEIKKPGHYVFVYGTLKSGEPNYCLIEDRGNAFAKLIGNARSVQKYPLVIASRFNIPYLLDTGGEQGCQVDGEIFEVDDEMLERLDELESHPMYYKRFIKDVEITDTDSSSKPKIVPCWCYFLQNFKPFMLKLPFLKCYQSKGNHGLEYVPRYARRGEVPHRMDVQNPKTDFLIF